MGFRLNRTYKLRFAGDLEGLEVDIRSTSVATVQRMREADPTELVGLLVEHMVRWNYEDDAGNPLPVSVDALLGLEEAIVAAITREWFKAAVGVSGPLDDGSTSGSQSPEVSIPMEAL